VGRKKGEIYKKYVAYLQAQRKRLLGGGGLEPLDPDIVVSLLHMDSDSVLCRRGGGGGTEMENESGGGAEAVRAVARGGANGRG
jgi:hypothetical protein